MTMNAASIREENDQMKWETFLREFSSANIYQTWTYGQIVDRDMRHFIISRGEEVLSIAQFRIVKSPLGLLKIAYLRWGPVMNISDPILYNTVLTLLIEELSRKEKMVIRIYPALYRDKDNQLIQVYFNNGFSYVKHMAIKETLLMDLNRELPQIRKSLKQKWRNCLNHAERNDLKVTHSNDVKAFELFIDLYNDLLKRKNFKRPNDIYAYLQIQKQSPEHEKMEIFLCYEGDRICSGAIISHLGNKAIYLYGAINELGMKNKSSYLIQWEIIRKCHEKGIRYYDLNGINAAENPGTYRFKTGLGHGNGEKLQFAGYFDYYPGMISRFLINFLTRLKYKKGRA